MCDYRMEGFMMAKGTGQRKAIKKPKQVKVAA